MRAKRKLVKYSVLQELFAKEQDGVPYARLIRDYKLDISTPHLTKLLHYYWLADGSFIISRSLTPTWLDEKGNTVQEVPDNYKYNGRFPYGEWELVS